MCWRLSLRLLIYYANDSDSCLCQTLAEEGFKNFKTYLDSLSIIGLLFTLIVMFALKGDLILEKPSIILQMAIPMTIFFWVMFAVVYLVSWKFGLNYEDSVAVAFNFTGRDFEIAIAIALIQQLHLQQWLDLSLRFL